MLTVLMVLAALLMTQGIARADHEPTFIEFSTGGEVFAFNFTHDTVLTFTIYDGAGEVVASETVLANEDGYAELWRDTWFSGPDPAVVPGYSAEVTDGTYTREVTLVDVHIDTYRIDENTMAGYAPPGETVTIRVAGLAGGLVETTTPAGLDGRWSVAVDPLVADLSDPDIHGEAVMHEVDGDTAMIFGSGSLNGEAGFDFDLFIVDGKLTSDGEDQVRMVIYAPDGSGPVYESDPSGGYNELQGSVVIHLK